MTFKLPMWALRSYLELKCEYEFHTYPNTKDVRLVEESHLHRFYNEPLCTWIKIDVNKFAIWDHTTLKLAMQDLISY